MESRELRIDQLRLAPWNPNSMDGRTLAKLKESIRRFGLVVPLVVRPLQDAYEVLSGNQRLLVLRDLGLDRVPCVLVEFDDVHAMLLAQALNRIQGQDDPGLEAVLLRQVIGELGERVVATLLPESIARLRELSSVGPADVASYLQDWEQARATRLHSFIARLSADQLAVVEEALTPFMLTDESAPHPNRRGNALYRLCQEFLTQENSHE